MAKHEKFVEIKISVLPKANGYIVDVSGTKYAKENMESVEKLIKAVVCGDLKDRLWLNYATEYNLNYSIIEK